MSARGRYLCVVPRRQEDEGEGGWCEGSHSGGDKVLDSSLVTMSRMSKSKHSVHTHLGTQRATLALPTFGQELKQSKRST